MVSFTVAEWFSDEDEIILIRRQKFRLRSRVIAVRYPKYVTNFSERVPDVVDRIWLIVSDHLKGIEWSDWPDSEPIAPPTNTRQ